MSLGAGIGRFRARLSLHLALLAAVGAGLLGSVAWQLLRGGLEERLAGELAACTDSVRDGWQREVASVAAAVSRVATALQHGESATLGHLLERRPGAAGGIARLARGEGLDILDILDILDVLDVADGDNIVLASVTWPELAGLTSDVRHRTGDVPALVPFEEPTRAGPALLRRVDLDVGRRGLAVVGGRRVDDAAVRSFGPGCSVSLVDRAVKGSGSVPVQFATIDPGGGHELRVEVDRSGIDAVLARTARRLFLASLLCIGLAALAGVFVGGRTSRPVAELVRAVDAIAAGRADYTFTRATEDEFEQLVGAFSRLHRSLQLQRERSQAAERVAAWREVARRVAHEVKNPLVPIRLTVENLVRAKRQAPGEFDAMLEEGSRTILEEVDRLGRLVGEFSEFARLPVPRLQPTSLLPLVEETLALRAALPGLVVERRFAAGLPDLALDADQVARALQNVVANAVEAMSELPPPHPLLVEVRREAEWVAVEVSDRGPGFPGEAERHPFEPYFTTKVGGTGLGLSITYRIVTEHGGLIRAENRPGGGARVTIRFPASGFDGAAASPSDGLP